MLANFTQTSLRIFHGPQRTLGPIELVEDSVEVMHLSSLAQGTRKLLDRRSRSCIQPTGRTLYWLLRWRGCPRTSALLWLAVPVTRMAEGAISAPVASTYLPGL